ncbi:hypothetical protein [Spiroplasma endosymbiont of Colias croceus]|uniref:hypothetical protein n=1 Tax=Spiroplasma endosymbiont of Colias croceus TaxID=3066310 RepID=UPI0030D1AE26
MAIKDPLMFITIEEFKNWKGFNKSLFDEVTTPDSEIRYAIEIASSNIDFLSGFTISKKWPEINPTKFTDNIQTATTHYVNFLLGKGVEYARGQASIGQGGITYSQNNPEDPYYIVPQVFNYLKEINEYPIMQGFNLNVSPKQNWFKKFMGNGGEQNPWEIYLQTINLKSSDPRTKINITHQKNIMGSVVDIDTRGIKSFDNLTTLELFTKYFSNDTMKLVDGKEGQEKKVISTTGSGDESLWEVDKDNPNFIKPKDDKGIDVNGRRLIDVGTPTFETDATTKEYVDKKQDKLIAGENIKIDEKTNTISATGGKVDLSDYYKKEEVDKKLEDTKAQFPIAFQINAIGQEIPNLETTNKTVVDAINEINKKESKDKWVAVGKSLNNRTWTDFKIQINKTYKVIITWETELVGYPIMILFKTAKAFNTAKHTIINGKIGNEEATLDITINSKTSILQINGGDINYGAILSLEIKENEWDVDLRDNDSPNPRTNEWKEVGEVITDKNNNNQNYIKYIFKDKTHYRIYRTYSVIKFN